MTVLPTEVRVNDDLPDGHPDLRFVQWTGPGSVNLAGPAAHDHIVRAGVPGHTEVVLFLSRSQERIILLTGGNSELPSR